MYGVCGDRFMWRGVCMECVGVGVRVDVWVCTRVCVCVCVVWAGSVPQIEVDNS